MGALISARKTVAATTVPETLVAASTLAHWVIIQGEFTNTNNAYVGAVAAPMTGGFELDAGVFTPVLEGAPLDLVTILVDVDTNGEGVNFTYQAYP